MPYKDRHGDRRGRKNEQQKKPEAPQGIDESCPVIQQFLIYQNELDGKHDKHERLVKLSRDVTIESKRTIFLLHRITSEEDKQKILPEAKAKLKEIQANRLRPIAKEMIGEDAYKYLRAYSAGLQEYIEALSFCHFLEFNELISLESVMETLLYSAVDPIPATETEGTSEDIDTTNDGSKESHPGGQSDQSSRSEKTSGDQSSQSEKTSGDQSSQLGETSGSDDRISVPLPPMEYILGVADLTGEVMRMTINSIGNGNLDVPFKLCKFLRVIYDAFLQFGNVSRELSRKMSTLKQSLRKVETACYTLQVRGSEIPKHMLVEALKTVGEGYSEFVDDDPSMGTV